MIIKVKILPAKSRIKRPYIITGVTGDCIFTVYYKLTVSSEAYVNYRF